MPGGRIVGFRIASGDVIDSIRFMYEDESHNKHHSNTYGGDGGTLNPPVNFDRDEDIIRFISISALFKHSSLLVPEKLFSGIILDLQYFGIWKLLPSHLYGTDCTL
ncbi:hypothetical protein L6452_35867 [Arctium lappa]|uniref:Uncharacterized protein n=1 Tax=Arctium lappa TaxID=4217 RepID=A0ACB8Y8B8_ARCLA|nr:hypothetical protein L6452_35867 [Arctium lappa]